MSFCKNLLIVVILSHLAACSVFNSNLQYYSNLDAPELENNPDAISDSSSLSSQRQLASTGSLITYCATQTAPASTVEEKNWRDAFSLEVMERICNKNPDIAKSRINFEDSNHPKYLESSWVYGINLTGIEHGVPRGTAITARHVIYTKHFGFHGQKGQMVWFLAQDNRLIGKKIVDVKYLDNADVAIARLESDLPGSISPVSVLDPRSFKLVPDMIPVLRIDQHSKALLVQKKGKMFVKPGTIFGTALDSPPEFAFAQYYQDMIRFDSSSPSLLILRNEFGVVPILYGLVTWGGLGDGPLIHELISEVEKLIESFGDSHKLKKVMPPVTPVLAPSCAITVKRAKDGIRCDFTVIGSADPVTGYPKVMPSGPLEWSVQNNVYKGKGECSINSSTVFQAILSGPAGEGTACEAAPIGPILPQCELSVARKQTEKLCEVRVEKLLGNVTEAPILTPVNPTDWRQEGEDWVGSVSCPLNRSTFFSTRLKEGSNWGPSCSFSVEVHPDVPTCEISSKRIGYSKKCEILVTRKSGIVNQNPMVTPQGPMNWVRNGELYSGTVDCSVDNYSTFSAQLSGPLGTGPVCESPSIIPVPVEIPVCDIQAVREGVSGKCNLYVNFVHGWTVPPPPIASPKNPKNWKKQTDTFNYVGQVPCAKNSFHQFSAFYRGWKNIPGGACESLPVDKIPAPSCSLEIYRQDSSFTCSYSLQGSSPEGTIAAYQINSNPNKIAWNGKKRVQGKFNCNKSENTLFRVKVWGPDPQAQSGSCEAWAPKLSVPSP